MMTKECHITEAVQTNRKRASRLFQHTTSHGTNSQKNFRFQSLPRTERTLIIYKKLSIRRTNIPQAFDFESEGNHKCAKHTTITIVVELV